MKKNALILIVGIVISHCLCPALATTYYVNPGQSIQTTIDSASYLDTVEVAAGTYTENITLKSGVALVGAGAASTTIDPNGGTVITAAGCDPNTRLTGFTITGAAGSTYGGGMSNVYSRVIITNCAFIANWATYGGAMRNLRSDPNLLNCIFIGNSATYGGAIHNLQSSRPTITNCTFTRNSAEDFGGVMRNHNSAPRIANCILWQNTAPTGPEISNSGCSPVISHSDIQGCGSSAAWDTSFGTDGGGNLDADPLFVDPTGLDDTPGTGDENLRLADGSPCIDAGDNSAIIANPLDIDGNPRISNDVVDMGAYERLCICSVTGDFNCSCDVDLTDFAILSKAWQSEKGQAQYNPLCDISVPADDLVDMADATVFAENWLQGF